MIPLEELSARFTSGVVIRVREDVHGVDALPTLREIVRGYPGNKPLRLRLELADGGCVTIDCPKSGVTIDPELRRRVDELLGQGNFRLHGRGASATPPRHQRPPPRTWCEADSDLGAMATALSGHACR